MQITIDHYESPRRLRALAAFISELADHPPEAADGRLDGALGTACGTTDLAGEQHAGPTGPVDEERRAPPPPNATPSPAADEAESVDQKGIPFDDRYCANAEDPFYASGARTGQWKKKRGVDDAAYDTWYSAALAARAGTARTDVQSPGVVNTGAAFGAAGGQQAVNTTVPNDAGSLIAWISEKQAAQLLAQSDIQLAYAQAGIGIADLFPPNDPTIVSQRVAMLYQLLAAKAGA